MSSLTAWPSSVLYFSDALGIKTLKEEQGSEKQARKISVGCQTSSAF